MAGVRTFNRAIGTQDAAVARTGAHYQSAVCTLVKVEAKVLWDRFTFRKVAGWTGYLRFQAIEILNFAATLYPKIRCRYIRNSLYSMPEFRAVTAEFREERPAQLRNK
jgi:hypothetical protein